jgi:hypothetical protein
MPIKMGVGGIKPGHEESTPLGVITETVIEEDHISGAGVVWPEERPSDVAFLTQKTEESDAYLSWELAYDDMAFDEDGIGWLTNPILLATTLVSRPAYGDRTRVLEISSEDDGMKKVTTSAEDVLPEVTEEVITEEVAPEVAPEVIQEETQEEAPEELDEEAQEALRKIEEYDALLKQIEELKSFKEQVEAEKAFDEAKKNVVKEFDGLVSFPEEDLAVVAKFAPEQMSVFKKYVSAKASRAEASVVTEVIPEFIIPTETNPIKILKNYMKK